MTWLPVENTAASERDAVLGLHPAAHAAHQRFLETCCAAFDDGLIETCRARMALFLGCREELARHSEQRLAGLKNWDTSPDTTPLERSALAFVDQFILDPALIEGEVITSLETQLGSEGVVNFAAVIAALEASIRLSALLDLEPAL